MSTLIPFLAVALLTGCACGLMPRRKSFANSALGTHGSSLTRLADAPVTSRHLLAKMGSDAQHISVCDAAGQPLGTMSDSTSAAGDPVAVQLLGCTSGTLLMVAQESLSPGDSLYTANGGKVASYPSAPGVGFIVGTALTAAPAGGLVEVIPCYPQVPLNL